MLWDRVMPEGAAASRAGTCKDRQDSMTLEPSPGLHRQRHECLVLLQVTGR